MYNISELDNMLKYIEDEENYYTGFRHVIESCASAFTVKIGLWNAGAITDTESLMYSERINKAKEKAIKTHKEWVKKLVKGSETKHTVESFVETIYNVIFY